jgi:tetratricopeptide (TPR) repeat protein
MKYLLCLLLLAVCLLDAKLLSAGVSLGSGEANSQIAANVSERLTYMLEKNQSVQEALKAFNARNLVEAERILREAKKASTALPAPEVVLSRWLFSSNQIALATAKVESYLVSQPNDLDALLLLVEVAMQSQRWTEAWLLLEKINTIFDNAALAVSESPAMRELRLEVLKLQGETAAQRKDWKTAEGIFLRMMELAPASGQPHWSLGRLRLAQGDIDGAFDRMKQGRKLDNKLPQPQLIIAVSLAKDSPPNVEIIEKWFQAGIKAEDAQAVNWHVYAKWLLENDRPQDVMRISDKINAAWTSDRSSQFLKGLAYRYLGDLNAAETIFKKLHQDNGDDVESSDQLALVLVEQTDESKRARAKQLSDTNLNRMPKSESIIASAAWIEFKLGSIDVADQMLGKLTSSTTISPQTAYYVAQVLQARGKAAEARGILEAACKAPGLWVQRSTAKASLEVDGK